MVGPWGGDYARLPKQNIGDPILKPAGVDVVGDETPRMAKMFAQRRLLRGTFDIACLISGTFMPDQFVPHIYSPQGLA